MFRRMIRTPPLPRRAVLSALGATLLASACARPQRQVERIVAPQPIGRVVPPDFGDSNPYEWPARGPSSYPVHGTDVSRWQGDLDWPRLRAHGVNFAFIKATEGGDLLDPRFREYWEGTQRAGVARGAYHFFYFCTPAAEQARWFISHVPRTPGALPPVLDLEWNHLSPTCTFRPPPEEVRAEARIWLDMVARHYGQRPVIYTPPDFWRRNDIGLLREEMWLRSVAGHPSDVYPGVRWTFWQYTGTGRAPGARGDIDLNVFAGTPAQWQDWLRSRTLV